MNLSFTKSFFCGMLLTSSLYLLTAREASAQNLQDINVTVELNDEDLRTLFQKIENQTSLRFAYNPDEVDGYGKITIPEAARTVKATLDLAFKGTLLRYRQSNANLIVYKIRQEKADSAQVQTLGKVSGTVRDKTGTPMPGVRMISIALHAQEKDVVSWKYSASRISKSEVVIKLTATMQPGWHIYSRHTEEGGPLPTNFRFTPSNDFELIEGVAEQSPVIAHYDSIMMLNIKWLEDTAIFTQRIKLNRKVEAQNLASLSVSGMVEYMACKDDLCLPPKIEKFSIQVSGE